MSPLHPAASPPSAQEGSVGLPASGTVPGHAGVRYAFTTRRDGTLSREVGDGDADANLAAVLRRERLPSAVRMRQVHSADVVALADDPRAGSARQDVVSACDGMVTDREDVTLMVLAADCVPVLLARGRAIGAVHAGRAGVLDDIADRAMMCLVGLGDDAAATAIIGPAIGPCCYEVPEDMAADAERRVGGIRATTTWGTPSLDLPGAAAAQLRRAAPGVAVHRVGGCTMCAGDPWFSHRASLRDGRAAGRHAGLIARTGMGKSAIGGTS